MSERIELDYCTDPEYSTYTSIIPYWEDNDQQDTFLARGPCGSSISVPKRALPPGTVIRFKVLEPQTGDHDFFEVSSRLTVSTGGEVPALPVTMEICHCLNSTDAWDFCLLTKDRNENFWYLGGNNVNVKFGAASELGHFVFETSRIGDWILVFDPLCDKIQRASTTIKKWDRFSLLPLIGSLIWDLIWDVL